MYLRIVVSVFLLVPAAILVAEGGPGDPVAAFLSYRANHDRATFYQCFSQRWQKIITPELREELATRRFYPIASASLVTSTDTTAVVRYSFDPAGKNPRMENRAYMIVENGRWVVDNFMGMTPEWAVPPDDRKELYDKAQQLLTDYYGIIVKGDTSALDQFMVSKWSKHSRAVLDGEILISIEDRKGKIELLSPICLTVGPVKSENGTLKKADVGFAYVVGWTNDKDEHQVTIRHGLMSLVKEDNSWKMSFEYAPTIEQRAERLLELLQQGDVNLVNELLARNTEIILSPNHKRTWGDLRSAVSQPTSAELVKGSLLGDTKGYNIDARISFPPTETKWPSGLYRIRYEQKPEWHIVSVSFVPSKAVSKSK